MISIVIRNKNEAKSLDSVLNFLRKVYGEDIDEIIVVDNNSTDQSIAIAKKHHCEIITIQDFTYGKAINLGIENAKNNLVLLLSAHAVPVGMSFFRNTIKAIQQEDNVAGVRFINSIENYKRALENNFKIKNGLDYGLMAACALVNKQIWKEYKFDENLVASEDKEWSDRIIKAGFKILDINETFFYFSSRDAKGNLKRWEIETIAHHQLHQLKYVSIFKILLVFVKRISLDLPKEYMKKILYEIKLCIVKIKIRNQLLNK